MVMVPEAPAPAKTVRAALYVRVSSAGQEEDGSSLATQEAAERAYALAHRYAVDENHVYVEVHTGTELWERKQLARLRDAVRRREVDKVICYAIDRLSRDPVHLGVIISEAEHAGVDVEFVTEPLDNSPEGQLIRFVRGYAAKVEHEKLKERALRGRRARAEAGKPLPGARPLYGYRWRDAGKTGYEIDPPRAAIVRRIFAEAARGGTVRGIANRLSDDGIPTPTGKRAYWSHTTVREILTTRAYTGRLVAFRTAPSVTRNGKRTHRDRADGQIPLPNDIIPSLIDEPTFEAIQEHLRLSQLRAIRNNRDPEATLLRGGVARCGYCGLAMFARRRKHGWQYVCRRGWGYRNACLTPVIAARTIDDAVWSQVLELLIRPEIIAMELERTWASDPTENDLGILDKALVNCSRRQANLSRALTMFTDEDAAQAVVREIESLTQQQRQLESERATVLGRRQTWLRARERLGQLEDWCRTVATNLKDLSYSQRRLALDALGILVRVWRPDHTPRFEVVANIPLEGVVVDGTAWRSCRGRR